MHMLYSKKTTQGTVYERCLFFVLLTIVVYALVFPCSTFVYYNKGKREEEEEATSIRLSVTVSIHLSYHRLLSAVTSLVLEESVNMDDVL